MNVPCQACGGTGLFGGELCLQCNGDGLEEVTGVHEVGHSYMIAAQTNLLVLIENIVAVKTKTDNLPEDLASDIAGILDKCNVIIAEQVSQREDLIVALTSIINEQASQRIDLTAILTNIWNKVKDI